MEKRLRHSIAFLVFVPLTALSIGESRSGRAEEPSWNPKEGANYLDGRAEWWLKWPSASRGKGTVCASCHTALPIALARPSLGKALNEATAGAIEQRLIDNMKKRVENWEKIVGDAAADKDPIHAFYADKEEASLGTEAVLNALILVNHDAQRKSCVLSTTTRKALAHLWEQQQDDGAWPWLDFGLNPWEKDGAYYGASLAAVAVATAGKSYYDRAEIRPRVASLKTYLKTHNASQPLHHRVLGLWASSRLAGILTPNETQKLIDELFSIQEADGGWSLPKLGKNAAGNAGWNSQGVYPSGLVSDGYATGLVVLALKSAGAPAGGPKLQKGALWLVTHQKEGSWPVNYLNKRRDPQDNVGKFMRDASTGFAILALTEPAEVGLGDVNGSRRPDTRIGLRSGPSFADGRARGERFHDGVNTTGPAPFAVPGERP
jgi:squalene-hopene/tetraprenyl-beta-curcumene cyclase